MCVKMSRFAVSVCVRVVMVAPAGACGSFCRTLTNYSTNAGHPIDTHSFSTTTHTHTPALFVTLQNLITQAYTHRHMGS